MFLRFLRVELSCHICYAETVVLEPWFSLSLRDCIVDVSIEILIYARKYCFSKQDSLHRYQGLG